MSVAVQRDAVVERTRQVLAAALADIAPRRFPVRFWTGEVWAPDTAEAEAFTLVLNNPGALRSMFFPLNDQTFGESYVVGDIDIEGDIVAAMRVAYEIIETPVPAMRRLRHLRGFLSLPLSATPRPTLLRANMRGRRHTRERDREANQFHYDRSNAFYQLWLDENMAYTCGYFESQSDTIDQAQRQKFDHVCRKLRLGPGDRLLDVGCGWGGLAMHAAARYGATVHAITNSKAQADLARQRVEAAGLADRCRIEQLDFRDLPNAERYDKISAVGVVEHLGPQLVAPFAAKVWQLLKPGGVFLNHGMTVKVGEPEGSPFLSSYVFPDAELISVHATLAIMEAAGFEVIDVENLRQHYAATIRAWRLRLDGHADEARDIVGEQLVRMYRIYFAGLEYAYRRGRINLHQTLLAKRATGDLALPLTRRDWYA
jgi:cyclopropane-fatty-acyl-phospholipid synthase